MLDAVLLEWDGVLADTAGARRDALLRALADEGAAITTAAYDACCAGLDVSASAAAALARAGHDDPTLTELVALRAHRAFVDQLEHGLTLMPGAAELVAASQHRVRFAIVTRATRAETEAVLSIAGLQDSFAVVVAADDVRASGAGPARYALALAHLSRLRPTPPERAVALVGTTAAIRDARASGVRSLAVGAPAHVALEADGAVDTLAGVGVAEIGALVGAGPTARSA
jgi:beta-phosphoglucomutase-like phosphatase (HAD superfamily)